MRVLALVLIFSQYAEAKILSTQERLMEAHREKLCDSADEYIKTMNFLRSLQEGRIPEASARQAADTVSKSCRGGAERFSRTFLLLRKMGVEFRKSLELALEFAREPAEVQENFFEVLKLAYVREMFDFGFQAALDVAYEFSKNLKSHHAQAREDFVRLAQFCRAEKELGLDLKTCSQTAVRVAHMSPYHPGGVFESFKMLVEKLRHEKPFGLSVREAMETAVSVLQYGPTAPENFLKGFEYAMEKSGLNLPAREALGFALVMSQRSTPQYPPPKVDVE